MAKEALASYEQQSCYTIRALLCHQYSGTYYTVLDGVSSIASVTVPSATGLTYRLADLTVMSACWHGCQSMSSCSHTWGLRPCCLMTL